MKIFITRPAGPKHPFELKFLSHWNDVANSISGGPAVVIEPTPHEIHGELLIRLWSDLRTLKEPFLISESDFWPFADEVDDLFRSMQRRRLAAVLTPLSRRVPGTDGDMDEQFYEPLVAPWFLMLNPPAFRAAPDLDWLKQGGPFNDAANLAFCNAARSGTFFQPDVKWLQRNNSLGPKTTGYCTKYLPGVHWFWARHWNDAPGTVLLPNGYDVQTHLAAIELWLTQRGK